MSRDGADREYQSYAVPEDVEREWLRELTARHLAALVKPGNWWTLNFLVHHRDTNHLERVIAAPPLGELWQRTAYLELLLQYIRACQSAGAPRARFQTGAGSYSKRPAGAHGQDRLGQPLPAPANMGVCGRQVHDRSDLVALSVLGPRFSPQETRHNAA